MPGLRNGMRKCLAKDYNNLVRDSLKVKPWLPQRIF